MSDVKTEKMIQIDIEGLLARSEEQVRDAVVKNTIDGFSRHVSYALEEKVKATVDDFFVAEILPELDEQLRNSKPELLGKIQSGLLACCEQLAEHLTKKAAENLSRSYQAERVVKELLS